MLADSKRLVISNCYTNFLTSLQHQMHATYNITYRGCEGWTSAAREAPSRPSPNPRPLNRLWCPWPRVDRLGALSCRPWRGVNWTRTATPACESVHIISTYYTYISLPFTCIYILSANLTRLNSKNYNVVEYVLTWGTGSRMAWGASVTLLRTCRLAAFMFCPLGSNTVTYERNHMIVVFIKQHTFTHRRRRQ